METVNRIGQNFTTWGLFRFALPAFFTNVFTQLFKSLDDALFISRFVGSKALAALNLLAPLNCVQLAFAHLCSLGSSTISARLMGEGKQKEAKRVFSRIVVVTIFVGAIFSSLVNIFAKPLLSALGADQELYSYAIYNIRLVYSIEPIIILNNVFALYYSTAGKPKVGTICSIANGTTNILLDFILIVVLKLGALGAAIATAAGEIVTFIIGIFFYANKKNEIHFVKPEGNYINNALKCFVFALPQVINSLSFAVTSLITNKQLLGLSGSDAVAANAIVSDIRSILMSGLVGIAASLGPVIAYNYGERNVDKLRQTLFSILKIWSLGSLLLVLIGYIIRTPLVSFYMSPSSTEEFAQMSLFGITIEILSIPFASACIIANRMFIALSNAKMCTTISIFRNLIFRAFSLILLPILYGVTGVWVAIPFGEFLSFVFASIIIFINRNNYGYGKDKVAYLMK